MQCAENPRKMLEKQKGELNMLAFSSRRLAHGPQGCPVRRRPLKPENSQISA
jgi:hypothetical protein